MRSVARRFRQSLEELGPTFVKLGQFISVRRDLLHPAFADELAILQSSVSPLPYQNIEKTLKSELGAALKEFEFIDETPLASGSIGQVHKGRLKGGQDVVVKIQRPGIDSQIAVDLDLMLALAQLVEKYLPDLRVFRPVGTVEEFGRALRGELDFVREAGNTTKIAASAQRFPYLTIPKVYWPLSTERVLTLEYLEGKPFQHINRLSSLGYPPGILVERGFTTFLHMVFVDGHFHGDLHPGNLFAMPEGGIGLIDFGITVRLSRSTRFHLAALFMALVNEDYDEVCSHFRELSQPGSGFDQDRFLHEVTNTIAPFVGLNLQELKSGRLLWEIANLSARHDAPVPRELILFLKSLVMLEGIGRELDPTVDLMDLCQKTARDIAKDMYSPDAIKAQGLTLARDLGSLLRHAPYQIRRLLQASMEGKLMVNLSISEVRTVSQKLDQASARLAASIICAAMVIASAILTHAKGVEGMHLPMVGSIGFIVAGFLGLYVLWSILRGGRL